MLSLKVFKKHVKSTEFHCREYIIHYGIEIQFCIKNFREGYLPYMRTQIYELLTHYGEIYANYGSTEVRINPETP